MRLITLNGDTGYHSGNSGNSQNNRLVPVKIDSAT